jgi:hypothetical protein
MEIQDLRLKLFHVMDEEEASPPFPMKQIRKELNQCNNLHDFIRILDEYGYDLTESIDILNSIILDK